jgi:hypothetical protein
MLQWISPVYQIYPNFKNGDKKSISTQSGMVPHTCNHSTQEAKAEDWELKIIYSEFETLSQKKQTKEKRIFPLISSPHNDQ